MESKRRGRPFSTLTKEQVCERLNIVQKQFEKSLLDFNVKPIESSLVNGPVLYLLKDIKRIKL